LRTGRAAGVTIGVTAEQGRSTRCVVGGGVVNLLERHSRSMEPGLELRLRLQLWLRLRLRPVSRLLLLRDIDLPPCGM